MTEPGLGFTLKQESPPLSIATYNNDRCSIQYLVMIKNYT